MAFMTAIHKPVLLHAAVGHLVMKHKNVRMSIIFSLSCNFKTKDASQLTGCKEKNQMLLWLIVLIFIEKYVILLKSYCKTR